MNLFELIPPIEKEVSTQHVLNARASATLIQIKKGGILREHQSRTPAMLVLLSGKAIYEEADRKIILSASMDIVHIPEKVTHKVSGTTDALLLLIQ
jgi:quercetin dioxygenase-like cupin family protein